MSILNKEKILELARLFVDEGRYDKAIKEYEKILLADPSDMRVKLRIAELHVKRKQIADAIRVYREVAAAYTQEGFYLKAVTVYKNILRLNPSMVEVNGNLADLYEKMGLVDDAVRQYDIHAAALEHKGELGAVMAIRRKIVELSPDNGPARVRLAELYQREGRADEALDQYEEYARRLEKREGDEARLIEVYEKILSHRSGREDMLRNLIRIHYRNRDFKRALRWIESAKVLTQTDPELLGMQAEIYAGLRQLETARSKYLALADLARERGDIDAAIDALARIVAIIPSEEDRCMHRAGEIGPDVTVKLQRVIERMRTVERERIEEEEITQRAPMPLAGEKAGVERPTKKPSASVPVEPKEVKPPKPEPPRTAGPEWDRTVIMPIAPGGNERKKKQPLPTAPAGKDERPASFDKTVIISQRPDPDAMKKAKTAYELASYLRKLGLESEALKEFARAAGLYKDLAALSAEAAARYAEIRVIIDSPRRSASKPKATK